MVILFQRMGKRKIRAWADLLEKHYHNPGEDAAYASSEKLKTMLFSKYKLKVDRRDIQKWLEKQYTYTIHRSRKKTFKRNPIIIPGIYDTFQADVGFLDRYATENDGFSCFLAVIDGVSRIGFCEPLKNKGASEMIRGMQIIMNKTKRVPQKLQTDAGMEFLNKQFKTKILNKYGIQHYHSYSDQKAAIVERFIKTMKEKIKRYMDDNATHRWVDVLQKLVHSYNTTFHKSIGMTPIEVTKEKEPIVLQRLYGHLWERDYVDDKTVMKRFRTPKFKVGDTVKLSGLKHIFAKGYEGYWTDEVFKITKVWATAPYLMYSVAEWQSGKDIKGRFYAEELSSVNVDGQLWRVEKILNREYRKGKLWFRVKWQNYPTPEWIPAENFVDSAKRAF